MWELQKIWRYIQGLCFRFSMFLLLCTISEKSASGIFIRNALSIMSAIFDWCLPQGAEMADDAHRSKISKLCRLCGKIASSNTSRPRNGYDSSCYTIRTSVTQNLFTRETCIKLENPFLWQFLTKNFHFGITRKLKKCSFYKTIWFWRAVQRKIVLRFENMRGSDCSLKFFLVTFKNYCKSNSLRQAITKILA